MPHGRHREDLVMKKLLLLRTVAVCCMIAIVAIRAVSLRLMPVQDRGYGMLMEEMIRNYLVQVACLSMATIVFAGIYKKFAYKISAYRTQVVKAAIVVFFLFCMLVLSEVLGVPLLWDVQDILFALWPVWMFFLAHGIKRRLISDGLRHFFLGLSCYYLVVAGLVWMFGIRIYIFFKEPVGMMYFFAVSAAAWILAKGRESREGMHSRQGQRKAEKAVRLGGTLLIPVVLLLLFFARDSRANTIAHSLASSFTGIEEGAPPVNWLEYRIAVFMDCLQGEFALFGEGVADIRNCPLQCAHYTMGWLFTLLAVLLEILLFYCIVSISGRKNHFGRPSQLVKTVLVSFAIQDILGLLADMFVISSTRIGVLLMKQPEDIMLLFYLVLFAASSQERRRKGFYIVKH